MTRKQITNAAITLGMLLVIPQALEAEDPTWPWVSEVCGGSTLQACVGFSLEQTGWGTDMEDNKYYEYAFTVEYLSTLQGWEPNQGVITAGGIYDPEGAPDFDFFQVTMSGMPGWSAYDGSSKCSHLNGDGPTLIEGCADTDNGVNYGLGVGDMVTFTFKSYHQFDPATVGGEIGARAHFQSYGSNDCSFKLDSRVEGGVVSPPEGGIDGCGNVVPEPMTVVLLATGLVGIGAVGYRNRRKEEDEV